uniref:Uncharacterized protein n=1 Tax=Mycena chlorophos TaxID=658473 RepID=A0ABQ0L111_MYCCL|nr:predicted protein [Mycena chlorophos]
MLVGTVNATSIMHIFASKALTAVVWGGEDDEIGSLRGTASSAAALLNRPVTVLARFGAGSFNSGWKAWIFR